ncbi:MAG: hypothetical protein OHK0011_02290 [Turneriella sp.]
MSLADQLFIASTLKYTEPEADFLPPLTPKRSEAMAAWRAENAAKLQKQSPAKSGRMLTGRFGRGVALRWGARAAVFITAVTGSLFLFTHVLDDTIRIEDELGKSAMGSEFGAQGRPIQLSVIRKRRKIGEITVADGSRLKVVKATNGDAFRSEVAFTGTEADFKLKYKGKASVIVKNGPFKAKVRIQAGSENDVHLKFRELGAPQPVGEPQFAIEVIKGNVQIAEADDGDDFEYYKEGEKAVFSLDDSESL